MSIATRISSIEEHIRQSYQGLRNIGIDTTNINKNLENIPKLLDNYWEYLPKVTGNGTNITLNDTKEAKMKLELLPDTQQETTTGKNLAKLTLNQEITTGGIKYTPNIDGSITIVGTRTSGAVQNCFQVYLKPSTTYYFYIIDKATMQLFTGGTLQGNFSSGSIIGISSDVNFNGASGRTTNENVDTTVAYSFGLKGYSNGSQINGTYYFMITEINNSTYEPYTNGASPNPDYPQEIKVVTGNQNIKVGNKNLIFSQNRISNILYPNGVTSNTNYIFQAGTYSVSFTSQVTGTLYYKNEDNDGERITGVTAGQNSATFTSTKPFVIWIYHSGLTDTDITNWQLEKGSTATSYVSHQEQNYQLTLGDLEYCKIGNYSDRIFKNVVGDTDYDSSRELGKWYVKKNIKKIVLDGSNDEYWYHYSITNGDLFRHKTITDCSSDINYTPIANYYKGIPFSEQSNRANNDFYIKPTAGELDVLDSRYTDASDYRTWLSTHNLIVYYALATPTYELLNNTLQDQLNALENAISYNNQTNISSSGNLASILNANALEDLSA